MEPGAVLVLIGRSIQEHHFAFVPALVGLLDVGQIERGGAVLRIGGHARDAAHVAVTAVRRIVLVPDVDGDLLTLRRQSQLGRACKFVRGWNVR